MRELRNTPVLGVPRPVRLNRFWSGQVEAIDVAAMIFMASAVGAIVACLGLAVWFGLIEPVLSTILVAVATLLLLALVGIAGLGLRGRATSVALAADGLRIGSEPDQLLVPWEDVAWLVVDLSSEGGGMVPVQVQLSGTALALDEPRVARMFGGDGLALTRLGGINADRVLTVAQWAERRFVTS